MGVSCPRVVIAGTHSGVGKTSVTLALVAAARRRGLRVQAFKVGPDYLDPSYLALAAQRPCYNLDSWMTGRDYLHRLFVEKASRADLVVVEGVMGLFDGADPVAPHGSTAEVAAWLSAPIILVVDAHGLARSIAPLVKGYAQFDPNLKLAGVIANHCGSDKHVAKLKESLRAFGLPGLLAAIPRGVLPTLPNRHLGLVTADTRVLPQDVLLAMGRILEQHGQVEQILNIAREAPPIPSQRGGNPTGTPDAPSIRLGLALDQAFSFYYPDNLEALQSAGCDLVAFSPLRNDALPHGLDGLYLGGGYPEEHAEALSENHGMLECVQRFARSGKPIYAECGGLMYLSKGIQCRDGRSFPMVGLLPNWTRMLESPRALGYVEVGLKADSLWGKTGECLRGHEFHYSELVENPARNESWQRVYEITKPSSSARSMEGFQLGFILASYVHAHWASRPSSVEHFLRVLRACKEGELTNERPGITETS
jgi:cobyrinic acid a,c-diamide synthase